jgi:outer membrane protein OmpA-like peptidoglycan-associated protein
MHDDSHAAASEVPPIRDRPESVGFWSKGWPILALGFMTLLFIRACATLGSPEPPASFDATAAAASANQQAMAALSGVTAQTPLDNALKALNLPVVNFPNGSTEIPGDARPVLSKAASVMKALPATVRLEVAGHTDANGTAEVNMLLSRRRAQAVVDFLVASGVPHERVFAQGYGDTRPVASNATAEGRFHNRRIEIKAQGR